MNSYELILIFDAGLGEEKIILIVSKVEDRIKSLGGELDKTEKWGVRKLASTMRKAKRVTQAYYVLVNFRAAPSVPAELQGYLKVTENIVRYSIARAAPMSAPEEKKEGIEAVDVGEALGTGEGIGES